MSLPALFLIGAEGIHAHPVVPQAAELPARIAVEAFQGTIASPTFSPWLVLVVLLALAVGMASRWPKAMAVALALFLSVFAFESAFHSLHHLWDPKGAAQCQLFSASQHVTGVPAATPDLRAPTPAVEASPSVGTESIPPSRFFRPDQGRAPPSLLA